MPLGENALAAGLWTLLHHPLWFLGGRAVFMLFDAWLLIRLWRFARGVFRAQGGGGPSRAA